MLDVWKGPHASQLYAKIAGNNMRLCSQPETMQEISMKKWFAPVIRAYSDGAVILGVSLTVVKRFLNCSERLSRIKLRFFLRFHIGSDTENKSKRKLNLLNKMI